MEILMVLSFLRLRQAMEGNVVGIVLHQWQQYQGPWQCHQVLEWKSQLQVSNLIVYAIGKQLIKKTFINQSIPDVFKIRQVARFERNHKTSLNSCDILTYKTIMCNYVRSPFNDHKN